MGIRTSDILIIAGLVLGVALAADLTRQYSLLWLGGIFSGIVVFAYLTGFRRGATKK
jgi:hypothetical protein